MPALDYSWVAAIYDDYRHFEVRIPPRRFLLSVPQLISLAGQSGLQLVSGCGAYDGSVYDAPASPVVPATLRRTR